MDLIGPIGGPGVRNWSIGLISAEIRALCRILGHAIDLVVINAVSLLMLSLSACLGPSDQNVPRMWTGSSD